MARTGKIARLPSAIREELNKRLQEGQLGPQLLPWLNSLPETLKVLDDHFAEQPINAQNLSDWRNGGYQDWLNKKDRVHRVRELAAQATELARANGGSIAEGALAIASGRILEALEKLDDATADGKKLSAPELAEVLSGAVGSLVSVRSAEIAAVRNKQNDRRLDQNDTKLQMERTRLEVLVCEKLLTDAVRRRADEIANSNLSNADKITAMRAVAFADIDALEQSGEVKLPD